MTSLASSSPPPPPPPPVQDIPTIDLSCFQRSSGNAAEDEMARDATAWRLDQASSQVGFFYVALPGLAEAAARLLQRCREFHDLPEATKMAVSSKLSPTTWVQYDVETGQRRVLRGQAMIDPPDPKEVMMLGSEEVAREGEEEEEGAESGSDGSSTARDSQWPLPDARSEPVARRDGAPRGMAPGTGARLGDLALGRKHWPLPSPSWENPPTHSRKPCASRPLS